MEKEIQEPAPAPAPVVLLSLNINEINYILSKLVKFPMEEVVGLYENIRNQTILQLGPPSETK
jgi:hypothetical protein